MGTTREGRIKQFCKKEGISLEYYNKQVAKGLKWCFKCRSWKDKNHFANDKSRWDGKKAACFDCYRVKEKKNMKGKVSAFKGKKHNDETIKVFKQINSGKNNPNWKGGVTKLIAQIRNSGEYKEWRIKVYYKGKFTCSNCGVKKSGNNIFLDADHIKSIANVLAEKDVKTIDEAMNCSEIFDIENGRCLCRDCHKKTITWGTNKHKYKNGN